MLVDEVCVLVVNFRVLVEDVRVLVAVFVADVVHAIAAVNVPKFPPFGSPPVPFTVCVVEIGVAELFVNAIATDAPGGRTTAKLKFPAEPVTPDPRMSSSEVDVAFGSE